ncbi:MAG: hypothetical protein HON77_09015, partial [Gammaproteobacteria bacterium]|nr:hypothetical protein [Gammaproteobacteria bacterium]MBT6584430.1 hypothetical protein [Gammaproteobacteria bacterium]MBT7878340.1 hypothetical protein [Gammaproteobacteria bacterium]
MNKALRIRAISTKRYAKCKLPQHLALLILMAVLSGELYAAPVAIDTDGDGIGDTADTDDDNDGMPDTFELQNALDPLVDDSAADPDGDGVSNL